MELNFGKKKDLSSIDFSKIKSGIKFEDIANGNDALKSIFSKFDTNADNELNREELEHLQSMLEKQAGEDGILSAKEAGALFDSKTKKEDAKNLFLFLKNLMQSSKGVLSVTNTKNLDKERAQILHSAEKEVIRIQQEADEKLSQRLEYRKKDIQSKIQSIEENATQDITNLLLDRVMTQTKELLTDKPIRQTEKDMDEALDKVFKILEKQTLVN